MNKLIKLHNAETKRPVYVSPDDVSVVYEDVDDDSYETQILLRNGSELQVTETPAHVARMVEESYIT
jgi:hypothetical protein